MRLWCSRAKGEPSRPPDPLPQVVCDAEEILRGALISELIRACDQAEVAVQAAFREWRCAYSDLAVAQRGGDPRLIVDAHVLLEQALVVAQDRSTARDNIRQALCESRIPFCAPAGRAMAAELQATEQGESSFAAGAGVAAGRAAGSCAVPEPLRRLRPVHRWLGRLLSRCTV